MHFAFVILIIVLIIVWYCGRRKDNFVAEPQYREYMRANPRANYSQFHVATGGDSVDYDYSNLAQRS